jgi:hypothetical protein
MKKLILGVIVLSGLLYGAWRGYLFYFDFNVKPTPREVLASEQALAAPGLLALASADIAHLFDLDRKFRGEPENTLPSDTETDDSVLASLLHAGIAPRRSLSHVLGGLFLTEDGDLATAVIMHGRFSVEVLTNFIVSHYTAEALDQHGFKTWVFYKDNKDYCEPAKQWVIALEPDRVILADPAIASTLFQRLSEKTAAALDLDWWRYFRQSHLAGAVLFVPGEETGAIKNPLLKAQIESASTRLNDFDSLYLGAKVKPLPPALNLTLWLATTHDDAANNTVQQWQTKLNESKSRWQNLLPTVASLHDTIKISTQPNTVVVQADLDKSWVEKLAEVPQELTSILFGGIVASDTADAIPADQEQLEQNPLIYQAEYPIDKLADYDAGTQHAGAVDTTAGPFGARIERISLTESPEIGLELDIKVFSTRIGNLGRDHRRANLVITGVNAPEGTNLVLDEPCGPERNTARTAMKNNFSPDVLTATKILRLRPSAKMAEITEIIGKFELDLPVKTESVVINNPQVGARLEGAGVQVKVTRIQYNNISYNVSGKTRNLIAIRALNAQGHPLAQRSSFGGDMFFGSGQFKSVEYAGNISQLEAVFATQTEKKEFPFTISGNRPTHDKDRLANNAAEFSIRGLQYIKQRFGKAAPALPAEDRSANVSTTSGPFTIILKNLASFPELQPHLKLLAPNIPNVKESLAAVQVSVNQIRLKNGTVYRAQRTRSDRFKWIVPLSMSQSPRKDYLYQSFYLDTGLEVKAEDVSHIIGEVTLFVPTAVDRFMIKDMVVGETAGKRGVDITIYALHRDKIELKSFAHSERILRIRPYNSANKELWTTFPRVSQTAKGWLGTFSVHGTPSQIEVDVPHTLSQAKYPFTLRPQ